MKKTILLCFCLWSVVLVKGQQYFNTTFSYDEHGNRTGRVIQFSRGEEGTTKDLKGPEIFSSVLDSFNFVDVNIYPNPTNDKVIVVTKGMENGQAMRAVLMDSSGKTLGERMMTNSEESFDLSGKASGIYLLVLTLDQEKHIWKVIKK
jgi:hypothetical protein